MTSHKQRITVTIDPALLAAGTKAVAEGRAESLSGWVNLALAERAEAERRVRALDAAIAMYEREHGVITDEEIALQQRADRAKARVIRTTKSATKGPGRRRLTR